MTTLTINAKDFDLKGDKITIKNLDSASLKFNTLYGNYYSDYGYDENGNYYEVMWRILDDFDPNYDDDESHACDWDTPWKIELIESAD